MKKLRFFDSLKLVLVTVACMFAIMPAHADNTWKYAPLPIGYAVNSDLVELTESNESFNTYTVKETTNTARRMLYITNANPLPANHKYFMRVRFNSNFTSLPYFRYMLDGTYTNIEGNSCRNNEWCNGAQIITPQQELKLNGASDGLLLGSNSYIAGETITIDKNGFLTVFDLTEIFGAGNEPTTVADAERALSIDTTIKIATTKYNEQQFAPVQNELSNAMNVVDDVVTRTMTQAQAIDTIATSKQTRPDEGCTAKYCLLVEGEDGTPHWYPIAGANGVEYVLPSGYTELQYLQTDGDSWIDTGIKGDMSYKYEIDFQQLEAELYRNWGAFDQSAYNAGPNMSLTYGAGFAVRWTVSGNANQLVSDLSRLDSNRHHIIIDNGYVTWDGVNKGRSAGHQDNYVFEYNLFLGTINPGGTTPTDGAHSKYYSYKVWNTSGELIQDLIPAKNSSGVVGMYDVVSGQFFTNAGTGDFTAGPDM